MSGVHLFRRVAVTALAVSLASAVLAVPPASADGLNVVVTACTESALRDAVTTAVDGATLTFGCDGTIALTAAGGGPIELAKSLTVDGSGRDVTLSGSDQTRIFWFSGGGTLTLRRLTLADGYAGDAVHSSIGGAVRTFGALVLEHVEFRDNLALLSGGAIAAQNAGASVSVTDSTFVGNHAEGPSNAGIGGGAIAVQAGGPTTIVDSVFANNVAGGVGSGGAVAAPRSFNPAQTGPISITGSTFSGNVGVAYTPSGVQGGQSTDFQGGGAVFVHNRALSITDSTFTDNVTRSTSVAQVQGGAVLVEFAGPPDTAPPSASISASTFENNSATDSAMAAMSRGGAVTARVPLSVAGSTFTGNTAADGGALALFHDATVTGSIVEGNQALSPNAPAVGGLLTFAALTVTDTSVVDNTDVNCGGSGTRGVIVDGGGNTESPGLSCRFGLEPAASTSTVMQLLHAGTDVPTATVQHTDRLDLRATVSRTDTGAPAPGMSVGFVHGSAFLGSAVTDSHGVARIDGVYMSASNNRDNLGEQVTTVGAHTTSTGDAVGSSASAPLTVTPEDLVFGPLLPTQATPGEVEVSARVTQVDDGSLGPIGGAEMVEVVAMPTGGLPADAGRRCVTLVFADATWGAERAGCPLPDLVAGTYDVTISSLGIWFTGSATSQLVVADPAPVSIRGAGRLKRPGATFRLEANASPGDVTGSFHYDARGVKIAATVTSPPVVGASTTLVAAQGTLNKRPCSFSIEISDVPVATRRHKDQLGLRTTCDGLVQTGAALTFPMRPLAGGYIEIGNAGRKSGK